MDISRLLRESLAQHGQGNMVAAKRFALQAMIGASDAKDRFLKAESDNTIVVG